MQILQHREISLPMQPRTVANPAKVLLVADQLGVEAAVGGF